MTTPFRTHVFYSPPSPLGLLPGKWVVDHHCTLCRRRVDTADLVRHAQEHSAVGLATTDDKRVP